MGTQKQARIPTQARANDKAAGSAGSHSSVDARLTADLPPIVARVLASSGEPLDPAVRAFMEPRFGHDFSRVRVHQDDQAAESARAIQAAAYTIGQDLVFGAGEYQKGTSDGRKLLAHELTHVVQQSRGGHPPYLDPRAAHERHAEAIARAVMLGNAPRHGWEYTGIGLARQPKEAAEPEMAEVTEGGEAADKEPYLVFHEAGKTMDTRLLLTKGTRLEILERKGDWMVVRVADGPHQGQKGLLRKKFIALLPKPAPKAKPPAIDLPKAGSAPSGFMEFDITTDENGDTVLESVTPESIQNDANYIDRRTENVGIRLIDSTFHLFIPGRRNPLTIPSSWFTGQTEAFNTQVYSSREQAIGAMGADAAKKYAFWRTDEGLILPTNFGPTSTPRIDAMARGAMQAAAELGKQMMMGVLEGMIIGKLLEGAQAGMDCLFNRALGRFEPVPLKIEQGGTGPKVREGEVPPTPGGAQGKPKMAPPSDPYDVEAWNKYYQENPGARRSVGAAAADDPAVFGPGKGSGGETAPGTGGQKSPVQPVKGPPYLQPEGGLIGQVQVPNAPTPQMVGQQIENPVRDLVAQKYGFKLDPKPPSATGPDIVVPAGDRARVGFDIADVKPLNEKGVKGFWDQLDSWRQNKGMKGRAAMFGYDANGNVYLYGIYDM